MALIISILLGACIAAIIIILTQHLGRISKHLRIIRLQLEMQNPMFTSGDLLELDKNIQYWQEKMFKYKDDSSERNKEIRDLTFEIFWAYVARLNHLRVMMAEARKTGDPMKTHEKYENWLHKNGENIAGMELKAKNLDTGIKENLDQRNLDLEFLGKWDRDEN